MPGVHVVVHRERVPVVGDVIEAGAQGPLEAQRAESALEMHVQREVRRITVRTRRAHKLLILIHQAERKPVAPVKPISERAFPGQRQPTPGVEPVWGVPGQRAAGLGAEKWTIQAEVQNCGGAGGGARIGSKNDVIAFEGPARCQLQRTWFRVISRVSRLRQGQLPAAGCLAYPVGSGFKTVTPRGGKVNSIENGWLCQGWYMACWPGELVMPLPPYWVASVLRTSR